MTHSFTRRLGCRPSPWGGGCLPPTAVSGPQPRALRCPPPSPRPHTTHSLVYEPQPVLLIGVLESDQPVSGPPEEIGARSHAQEGQQPDPQGGQQDRALWTTEGARPPGCWGDGASPKQALKTGAPGWDPPGQWGCR